MTKTATAVPSGLQRLMSAARPGRSGCADWFTRMPDDIQKMLRDLALSIADGELADCNFSGVNRELAKICAERNLKGPAQSQFRRKMGILIEEAKAV